MIRNAMRIAWACALALLFVLHPGSSGSSKGIAAESLPHANSGMNAPQTGSAVNSQQSKGSVNTAEKRSALLEQEASLNLKEQELRRLGQSLESKLKQLEEARKSYEASREQQKKTDDEKFKKILKVYKSLRPEEAAALLDKLDEDMALEMLSRMDQKTTVKLIPFLNQTRVLKWTRLSLKGE